MRRGFVVHSTICLVSLTGGMNNTQPYTPHSLQKHGYRFDLVGGRPKGTSVVPSQSSSPPLETREPKEEHYEEDLRSSDSRCQWQRRARDPGPHQARTC